MGRERWSCAKKWVMVPAICSVLSRRRLVRIVRPWTTSAQRTAWLMPSLDVGSSSWLRRRLRAYIETCTMALTLAVNWGVGSRAAVEAAVAAAAAAAAASPPLEPLVARRRERKRLSVAMHAAFHSRWSACSCTFTCAGSSASFSFR